MFQSARGTFQSAKFAITINHGASEKSRGFVKGCLDGVLFGVLVDGDFLKIRIRV